MKLQVGERYRRADGEIREIVDGGGGRIFKFMDDKGAAYTENGCYLNTPTVLDLIEIIPKEKDMKDKTTIRGLEIEFEDAVDGSVTMTFEQIQKAYEQMQRIKAENEIKAGDWVTNKENKLIGMVDGVGTGIVYCRKGVKWSKENCIKITNPAHIQALKEIYEGMK